MISFGVGRHFGAAQILPMGCALPKALVKSNHEDGLLFAALSHKTLELLYAVPQQVFNRMDLCQFLGREGDKDSYFGIFCLIGFKGILGRSVVESVLEIVEGPLQMGMPRLLVALANFRYRLKLSRMEVKHPGSFKVRHTS